MSDTEFRSCFISYAHANDVFAKKLHDDLEAHGVSCWMDFYDMGGGQFWRAQIQKAIKNYDKLLLVCSGQSMLSAEVANEIVAAIERERENNARKLFPIRIDDFILSKDILLIADAKLDADEWPEDWVRYVRAFHIPDFRQWQDLVAYQKALTDLLRDLK